MRTKATLVALSLLAVAATARAEEGAPTAVAESGPTAQTHRRLQVGASFLPMAMGKYKFSDTFDTTTTQEAYLGYGVGLSVGYDVWRGLIVGLAPQLIFNVQPKPNDIANPNPMRELDLMARVAYQLRLVDTISVYAEALPGYSVLLPSDEAGKSKGLVLGFGAGVVVDMTDRVFLNVGGGYQIGFQTLLAGIHETELRTRYVRVAIGGGVKF